jgi:putative flippase GtrA
MLRHAGKFIAVGVVNTLVYYGTYLAFRPLVGYLVAHLVGLVVSMVGSFFLNCLWTFRTRPTWGKFAVFPLTNATNYLMTTVGVVLLVHWWHVDEVVAPLIAAAGAVPVTFLLSRRVLLGRAPDGGAPAVPAAPAGAREAGRERPGSAG